MRTSSSIVIIVALAFATPALGQQMSKSVVSKTVLKASKAGVSPARMRMLTIQTGDLLCKGQGAGSLPYISCTEVPVIVLRDDTAKNGCSVIVPYRRLIVYTKREVTPVTWKLIAEDVYVFYDVDGVAIPTAPANIYKKDGANAKGREFTWTIAKDAKKYVLDHVVNVKGPKGPCDQGDPTVINDPNDPPG